MNSQSLRQKSEPRFVTLINDQGLWVWSSQLMQKAPAVWDALPQRGAVVLTTDRDCFKSSDCFLFYFFLSTLWYQYASGSIMWSDSGRCTIWTKVHCSICRCDMALLKWHNNAYFTHPLSPILLYSSRYYQSFSKLVFWVASVFMIPICIQIKGFVDWENLPPFTQSLGNSSRSALSLQQRVFLQLLRANFFF